MPDLNTYISDTLCGRPDRAPGQPYKKSCKDFYKNTDEGKASAQAKFDAFLKKASAGLSDSQ